MNFYPFSGHPFDLFFFFFFFFWGGGGGGLVSLPISPIFLPPPPFLAVKTFCLSSSLTPFQEASNGPAFSYILIHFPLLSCITFRMLYFFFGGGGVALRPYKITPSVYRTNTPINFFHISDTSGND